MTRNIFTIKFGYETATNELASEKDNGIIFETRSIALATRTAIKMAKEMNWGGIVEVWKNNKTTVNGKTFDSLSPKVVFTVERYDFI